MSELDSPSPDRSKEFGPRLQTHGKTPRSSIRSAPRALPDDQFRGLSRSYNDDLAYEKVATGLQQVGIAGDERPKN